jgi:hemoglobin
VLSDIESRDDIDLLMTAFYEKAMRDELIGFFFTEIAKLDLEHHLPIIGDFWETVLFGTSAYRKHGRAPLQVHALLHERSPLEQRHFDRWLELFTATIDARFSGPRAEFAKQRAVGIAHRILDFLTTAA